MWVWVNQTNVIVGERSYGKVYSAQNINAIFLNETTCFSATNPYTLYIEGHYYIY